MVGSAGVIDLGEWELGLRLLVLVLRSGRMYSWRINYKGGGTTFEGLAPATFSSAPCLCSGSKLFPGTIAVACELMIYITFKLISL